MKVASEPSTGGIYVYTHSKITDGPFKGSNKVAWLNHYDYEVIDKQGDIWKVRIQMALARHKNLIG